MASTSASGAAADEQSLNVTSRITKDGRKISYRLNVVQQPERARACGQGAKSSSDRRPVDPPPIVELRILEGDQNTDITFPYNASFFLFATLEPARPIAQARGSHSQANNAVLTGAPAVGVSYLDRPTPAGYFIFPDLSVRHEGQYRLRFALFEAMKEPQDVDVNAPNTETVGSYYHNRCEVNSEAFHVYSAKKFPGLTESTLLSRVVADQGCRVRIRRDVRMRRRDSKDQKDWDDADEAPTVEGAHGDMGVSAYDSKQLTSPTGEQHHHQHEQPEKFESAPSSTSTHTIQAPPQPSQSVQQSMQVGFSYPQWYQYPPTTQQNNQQMYASHTPAEQAYVQQQQQQQYQAQYSPTHAQQIGQVAQYPSAYSYQQNASDAMVQNASLAYQSQSQQQQQMPSMYTQQQQQDYSQQQQMRPQTANYNPSYNAMEREPQSSVQYFPHQQLAYQQHQQAQPTGQQQQQMHHQQHQQQVSNVPLATGKPLPPLEVPRVSHTTAPDTVSPLSATAGRLSGSSGEPHQQHSHHLHNTNTASVHDQNSYSTPSMHSQTQMMRPPPPQFLSSAGAGLGQKRSYGASFNTMHTQEAMRNGARPNPEVVPQWSDGQSEEDLQDLESIKMEYRRADGSYTVVSPRRFTAMG